MVKKIIDEEEIKACTKAALTIIGAVIIGLAVLPVVLIIVCIVNIKNHYYNTNNPTALQDSIEKNDEEWFEIDTTGNCYD